ncbi:MAG: SAM-dependent methyltransferase [Planctomycetota bacterium]|jgi:SAM-dependent methyltransferase
MNSPQQDPSQPSFSGVRAPQLAQAFEQALRSNRPSSVLDVGCGAGALVKALCADDIPALGIEREPSEPALATGRTLAASAELLPFADGSFDWVVMRHVPHHLEHPAAAFAEAWRVCKSGVQLAEPWYDTEVPSQRQALEIDRWLKHKDRRRGMFHADILSAKDLIALLPSDARCQVQTLAPLLPYPEATLEQELSAAAGDLPLSTVEQEQRERFLAAARADQVSMNGTLILTARKPN